MRKLFLLSILVAVLVLFVAATGAQAFTLLPYAWPTTSTTYAMDASFTNQGLNWTARANDAAQHWTDLTVFDFIANAGSPNRLRFASLPTCILANTDWTEDALGIYRTSFIITVNSNPTCGFVWYAGTGTPPIGQFDLRTVLRHEFGHAAGLNHVLGAETQLMHSNIAARAIKQIAADDQNGVDFLYNPDSTNRLTASATYYTGSTYDNPNYAVGYKGRGWAGGSGFTRALLQTHSWSNLRGASSWFPFQGNRITWVFTKATNRGWHEVYINGMYQESINTDDDNDVLWQVHRTWDMDTYGQHVIEIRKPTEDPFTPDYTDLDAYVVNITQAGGVHDDASGSIRYLGSWTHGTGWAGATNGTTSWSNTEQDAIVFTFLGDGITYRYSKVWNRGIAKVTIDGNFAGLIDLYDPNLLWQQTTRWALAPGTHTIHIAVTGDKNPNSSGTYIDVDQFEVD